MIQTIEIHSQVAREGINQSVLATYDNYTWISNITERVVQGTSAMQTRMLYSCYTSYIHIGPYGLFTQPTR